MGLTINDVEKVAFPGGFFGYQRGAVEDFRHDVAEALQELIEEIDRLKKDVERLNAELDKYRATEKLLQESVILAQKSHDQIVAAARQDAANILQEARLKAVELSRELGVLSAERERFAYEFHALLRGFLERLEHNQPDLAAGLTPATGSGEESAEPQPAPPLRGGETTVEPAVQSTASEEPSAGETSSPFPDERPR